MADNMNGVYNEVLKVTFDTAEWTKSLNAAREEWKKFKGDLGKDANNVIGTHAMSSMVEGIKLLTTAVHELRSEQLLSHKETIDLLGKETAATVEAEKKAADAIDKKLSKQEKYLQSLKRTAEFTDNAAQPFGLNKTARDIRTESEGVSNLYQERLAKARATITAIDVKTSIVEFKALVQEAKSLEDKLTAAKEVVKELSEAYADTANEANKLRSSNEVDDVKRAAEMERVRLDIRKQLLSYGKQILSIEDKILATAKKVSDANEAAKKQYSKRVTAAQQALADLGQKDTKQSFKELVDGTTNLQQKLVAVKEVTSALAAELKVVESAAIRSGQSSELPLLERSKVLRQQALDIRKQLLHYTRQQVTLEEHIAKLSERQIIADSKRIAKIQDTTTVGKPVLGVDTSAVTVENMANARRRNFAEEMFHGHQRVNRELEEQEKAHKKVTAAADKHRSVLDRLFNADGWKSTLAHLLKFYVLWNTLNGVIQTTAAIIQTPFKMIGMGLKYLQDTERAADDLVGVIATNAKFSKNYADNFREAKEQAIEVTKKLQEQAILTGFTSSQLEGTFKALMESGANRFVSTLGQMVDLATMFQMALKAAGAGGLAAQTSVQEMGRLFRGTPAADNKFLAFIRMSVGEWTQLRERVKETRDLVPILAARTKEFRDALLEAGKGQRVLLDTLQLQLQRLMGDATSGLFDTLNKALLDLSGWVAEHKVDVIALFTGLSTALQGIVETVRKLGNNQQVFDGLLAGVGFLTAALQETVLWLETMLKDFDDIATHGFWKGNVKSFIRHRQEEDAREENQVRSDIEELRRQDPNASRVTMLSKLVAKGYSSSDARHAVGMSIWDELNPDPTVRNSKLPAFIGPLQSKSQDMNASFVDRVRAMREEMKASMDAAAKESAARLEKTFAPGDGNNGRTDSLISNYVRKYELIRSEIELKIKEIEEKYAEKRNSLREQLDGDFLTKKEFSTGMAAVVEEENAAILEQQQKLMEEVAATRQRILGEGNIDTKKSRDEAIRFSKLYVEVDKDIVQRRKRANKEISDSDRQAVKEQVAIAASGYKLRQELLTQDRDNQLKQIAENKNAGYLTEVQAFDEEVAVKRAAYSAQIGNLFDNLMSLPEGSEKWVKVLDELIILDKQHTLELERQSVISRRLAVEEQERLETHLRVLREQRIQSEATAVERDRILNPNSPVLDSEKQLLVLKEKELVVELAIAKAQYLAAVARNADAEQTQKRLETLGELNNSLDAIQNTKLTNELAGMSGGLLDIRRRQLGGSSDKGISVIEGIFGVKLQDTFKGASSAVGKFGAGLVGAANALTTFQGVLNAIKQGYAEGGVLGGIGAGATQAGGLMGSFKGALGAASPYVQAIGAVFSVIGGLMKAAARKLADSLRKSFDNLMLDYERGNRSLVSTITEIEKLRQQAITSLSGKKGGKEELDKLLPQFESQLYSLKEQQEQILESFTESLDALRLSSDTLTDIHKQWSDINKQVQEYLGAGGSAADAAEYLSLQLGKIRADVVAELDSAEQDAIETMLQLNDLLKQRIDLVEDFKQKEFDLINADSIERRGGGSVARGRELANLRKAHEERLTELDEEIQRTQQRVDKEQEIFNLHNDVAELKRRDEELTLKALDQQIQKLKDLQAIVSSITLGQSGWIGSGMLGPQSTTVTIDVSITSPIDDPTSFGKTLGENLANEFLRQVRVAPA